MAMIKSVVIADAGPIIHLDELNSLNLLADFTKVIVPETVWQEVERHRPFAFNQSELKLIRQRAVHSSAQVNALIPVYSLHAGEQEALHLCVECENSLLLTDDTAARLAAKSLGITAHGTVGVLVRSIRQQTRSKLEVLALFQVKLLYIFELLY